MGKYGSASIHNQYPIFTLLSFCPSIHISFLLVCIDTLVPCTPTQQARPLNFLRDIFESKHIHYVFYCTLGTFVYIFFLIRNFISETNNLAYIHSNFIYFNKNYNFTHRQLAVLTSVSCHIVIVCFHRFTIDYVEAVDGSQQMHCSCSHN